MSSVCPRNTAFRGLAGKQHYKARWYLSDAGSFPPADTTDPWLPSAMRPHAARFGFRGDSGEWVSPVLSWLG